MVEEKVNGVNGNKLEMGMRPKDLSPTQVAMLQEVRRLRDILEKIEEELAGGEVDLRKRSKLASSILGQSYDILRLTVV